MKPLIALVDDESALLEEYTSFLAEEFQVVSTENPENLVDLIRALDREPDLIITDLMMPNMTGQELIGVLRDAGIQSKIVIASAYTEKKDAITAINDGIAGILEKPFKPDDLQDCVNKVLARSKNDGSNPLLVELCEELFERSQLLENRIFEIENLCDAAGIRLFKDADGYKNYIGFMTKNKASLKRIAELKIKIPTPQSSKS